MAYADVRCSQSKMASVVLWVLCSKYLGVKLNCFSGSSYHAYQVVDSEQDLHLYFWEKQKSHTLVHQTRNLLQVWFYATKRARQV